MPITIINSQNLNTTIVNMGDNNYMLYSSANGLESSSIIYVQATADFTFDLSWSKINSSDNTNNDRIFWYIGQNPNLQPIYDTNSSYGSGNADTSTYLSNSLSSYGWNDFSSMIFGTNATQSGTQTISISANQYIAVMIAGNGTTGSTFTISGFPNDQGTCFLANTKILMGDGTTKFIKDIKQNDLVMTDIKTNKCLRVCRITKDYLMTKTIRIPKNLISNTDDIFCSAIHPIWIENDTKRIFAKNIKGVEIFNKLDYFYNIQFETEGTFYAEGVKVDSLSPHNNLHYLPIEYFKNKENFKEGIVLENENDPFRNKPYMELK